MTTFKLGFLPSMLIAMAICTLLGMAIEKIAYKPLRNATRIAVLITAIEFHFSSIWNHVLCRRRSSHLSAYEWNYD